MKGLDLKRFKKIHTDKIRTVFKDNAGHEVRVAHAPLSPARRKQLDAIPLAEGGEVEELSDETKKSGRKFGMGEDTLRAIRQYEVPPEQKTLEMGPVKPNPTLFERVDNALSLPGEQDEAALKQWQQGVDKDKQVLAQAEQRSPQSVAQSPQAPILQPQVSVGDFNNLTGQFTQGAQQEARAIGELGKQQAGIQNEQLNNQKALMDSFNQKSQSAMNEINAVMQDYQKQYINPNHYMESMSSGKKVMTAIGLILGGMGAGLTGGENTAAKFLNDQIGRDIEAQRANLGKKESLLNFNLKQYGNMKDAIVMTDAMMKGIYATKLEQAAALSKDPMAKARALQLSAQFKAQILPNVQKLAQNQTSQAILNNPQAPPMLKIQALPKEMQDNALKEMNEYKMLQNQLAQVGPVMKEAFKNTTAGEKIKNPIQSGQRAKVAFAQLFPIAKAIAGERMTDADARALIEPYLPSWNTNAETMNQNIQKLEKQLVSMANGRTPILSQYGIVPPLQASAERKTMGGVEYEKVPGGWKKVK